jgi:hypothetical protein
VKETLAWQQTDVPTKTSQHVHWILWPTDLRWQMRWGRQPRTAPFWADVKAHVKWNYPGPRRE